MRDHLPWLGQGDIFAEAPVTYIELTDTGLKASLPLGPAILLTHGCAMDKPDRSGQPRAEWLQFARLRAVDALPQDRQALLRQAKLTPYEALYVGEVAELGESFILLTDPYHLPAAYFALKLDDYTGHPSAETNARYVAPQLNDTRLGCLDEEQVELLRKKMLAFWARVTTN